MENSKIKNTKTIKKYAEALYSVSKEKGAEDAVLKDVVFVSSTMKDNYDLKRFINNPIISDSDKKEVINSLFEDKISESTKNFLYILIDNNRSDLIYEIEKEYRNLVNESKNIILVKATTAIEMAEYLKEKLKSKLELILSAEVEIEYKIEPNIIGGLILEVNNKTIDSSILTKLKKVKKQLI